MKKTMLLGLVFTMLIQYTNACNICGGGGGNYLGLLPQYQKHFIGLRYQTRSFQTTHPPSIIPGMTGRKSNEFYQTVEIAGRYCPGKRWQLLGFAQYQFMHQTLNQETNSKQGNGDPIIMGYYSIISGAIVEGKKWRHLLQAGAGIKLPLGAHSYLNESELYNPVFQAGTGSWDKLVSLIYSLRAKKSGVMADVTTTLNGKNNVGYQFGHRISGTLRVFHLQKIKKTTLLANCGMFAEHSMQDIFNGNSQDYTGGSTLMPSLGLDYFRNHLSAGINYRCAVWQNLGDGYIKSNARLLVNVSYMFN
jgi:hypothetical protein